MEPNAAEAAKEIDEKFKRYSHYWRNAESVRERNRAYYYTRRGLPVPEKKEYKLRRTEDLLGVFRDQKAKLDALEKRLQEKEAELEFREKQVAQIEKSYTLKSYQPTYKAPSAQKKSPVCAVGSAKPAPKPEPVICFTLGGGSFV